MRTQFFIAVAASILVGLTSVPASAKTKAQCTKEWQANSAANHAAGKTERVYVAECRGTAAAPAKPEKDYSGSGREGGGGGKM